MEQDVELLTELVQSLTNDVADLKKMVANRPAPATPPDMRPTLEKVANALNGLRGQVETLSREKPIAPAVDLSRITTQLERIEQASRQRPEYRMSQYVQYGAYAFGLMVTILVTAVWFSLTWRRERDQYAQAYSEANWRVRYTRQANADYYSFMEAKLKDPAMFNWIVEQEQADEKRALAKEAAEQAKALSDQANQLEGKSVSNGRKK